jgi:hypothetical protein
MSEDAAPGIAGIHHFSITCTDIEASLAWYQRLLRADRVPMVTRLSAAGSIPGSSTRERAAPMRPISVGGVTTSTSVSKLVTACRPSWSPLHGDGYCADRHRFWIARVRADGREMMLPGRAAPATKVRRESSRVSPAPTRKVVR